MVHPLHAQLQQVQEDSFALKTVLQYYGYWEPPPVPKDAVMFYERVLLPKVSLDELKDSITLRGASWLGSILAIIGIFFMELHA